MHQLKGQACNTGISSISGNIWRVDRPSFCGRIWTRRARPILAATVALRCPIWTEDTHFFAAVLLPETSGSIDVFLAQ